MEIEDIPKPLPLEFAMVRAFFSGNMALGGREVLGLFCVPSFWTC